MYPFVKGSVEMLRARRAPPLLPGQVHETHLRIWPWDLDFAYELNNGRTLTLMDAGRLPMFQRTGLFRAVYGRGWFMTMAGVSVRWRRRVKLFDRVILRTRLVGWDARFFYVEQAMCRPGGEVANHALYRVATSAGKGLLNPAEVAELVGWPPLSPVLPDWITAWAEADALRPWPPFGDESTRRNS